MLNSARGKTGADRVIRGGSWNNDAHNCRSAIRNNNSPDNRNNNVGFRLASSRQRPDAVRPRIHRQRQCPDHRPGPVPADAGQISPARRLSVGCMARKLPLDILMYVSWF
ncbi:MAG: SUMF1/EgtB/PvdO family nonheme iron enzyme [Deltaproteobacteria bacterium]|jgi:hypothetical protein|nr:SUMF1/EgtB/PvdO family nonheme iron enzyme [Deltaproteobacteria bacterium]